MILGILKQTLALQIGFVRCLIPKDIEWLSTNDVLHFVNNTKGLTLVFDCDIDYDINDFGDPTEGNIEYHIYNDDEWKEVKRISSESGIEVLSCEWYFISRLFCYLLCYKSSSVRIHYRAVEQEIRMNV